MPFSSDRTLRKRHLGGEISLAHTRYRTTGPANDIDYTQPMLVEENGRTMMGGHNGNIANAESLKGELLSHGVKLKTSNEQYPVSDSEVLFHRIARAPGGNWGEKVARGLEGVEGSYCLTIATDNDELIAGRDPWGIRPLSFGRLDGHWIVASETSVLYKIRAIDQREVDKGQMWIFRSGKEPESFYFDSSKKKQYCDFEDWYFSWPSSRRNNIETNLIREESGRQLALEEIKLGRLINADLVTCVPDTGRSSAVPFAEKLGIPYRDRIFKERYDDKGVRSFIGSNDLLRTSILEDKYLLSQDLRGRVVYIVDDTGIRLKTTEILNRALRQQTGVKEIHWRFAAPKFVRPCFLGVNINQREELGAVEFIGGRGVIKEDCEIAKSIGADSVAFLSVQGKNRVREVFGEDPNDFCGYCHGENGPSFGMSKYDQGLLLESGRSPTFLDKRK